MKNKIHPQYTECAVTCGCGNTFVTRSTRPSINVEICSNCHPFYTGKQKYVDTAGRVEKFQKRHSWDDTAMEKLLQKEKAATKRPSKKLERVTVGVPKIKRRKTQEPEPEEPRSPKEGGARGPRSKEGPKKEAAQTRAGEGSPGSGGSAETAGKTTQQTTKTGDQARGGRGKGMGPARSAPGPRTQRPASGSQRSEASREPSGGQAQGDDAESKPARQPAAVEAKVDTDGSPAGTPSPEAPAETENKPEQA